MYKVYWSDKEGTIISTHALEYIKTNQKINDVFTLYKISYKVSNNGPVSEKRTKIKIF